MSDLSHLVIILPCHSLEDFPTHFTGPDAENLLSHWSALWHPALLATANRMPQWHSTDASEPSWTYSSDTWKHDADPLAPDYPDPLEAMGYVEPPFDHPEEINLAAPGKTPADEAAPSHSATSPENSQVPFPLVLVPAVSDPLVDTDLLMRCDQDGVLITDAANRDQIIQQVAQRLPQWAQSLEAVDPETVQDFYALGYAYLQVQLMTRQLRYSSNLDEHEFEQAVLAAARAAMGYDSNGDSDPQVDAQNQTSESTSAATRGASLSDIDRTATDPDHEPSEDASAIFEAAAAPINAATTPEQLTEDRLTRCFDLLLEEKNAYYPVEPNLCDVILTTDQTLGRRLEFELQGGAQAKDTSHKNLLLTGSSTLRLKREFPDRLDKIHELIQEQRLTIIGGLADEHADWLLTRDAILELLRDGLRTMETHLRQRPKVYLRRTFGNSPTLPGLLVTCGFTGAVHSMLTGGSFPKSANGVIRWAGEDGQSILAIGDDLLNANNAGSFLGLGIRLGEMIDSAHMASVVFVRWPNQACESMRDLRRIANYSPLFGEFVGLNDFFDSVYDPGYPEAFTADEYRSGYLAQMVTQGFQDPVSRFTRFHQWQARIETARRLLTLALLRHQPDALQSTDLDAKLAVEAKPIETNRQTNETQRLLDQLAQLDLAAIKSTQPIDFDSSQVDQIEQTLQQLESESTQLLACGTTQGEPAENTVDQFTRSSVELINPASVRGDTYLRFPTTAAAPLGAMKGKPPIKFVQHTASEGHWIVELPGTGSVTLDPCQLGTNNPFAKDPAVASEQRLQNEFFIANVDSTSGGIRSVNYHNKRINLFTQQLAIRIPAQTTNTGAQASRQPARYTTMKADQIRLLEQTSISGAVESKGRLLDGEETVCEYTQTISLARGIARLNFDVQLKPVVPWRADPNHYACLRIAWKNESASIVSNVIDSKQPVVSDWFHATRFVSIGDEQKFTLLTGGLPFHRRSSRRMLDSLLMVSGETCGHFTFAVEIDQAYGYASAVNRLMPKTVLATEKSDDTNRINPIPRWLIHLDCKNTVVSRVEPLINSMGTWSGLRLHIHETEGRSAKLKLRCRRPIATAEQIDGQGNSVAPLEVDANGAVTLPIAACGFEQINLYF